MKLYDIAQGWSRLALKELNLLSDELQEQAKTRIRHCETCTMRVGMSCSKNKEGVNIQTGEIKPGCGCALRAKVLSDNSKCPLSKW